MVTALPRLKYTNLYKLNWLDTNILEFDLSNVFLAAVEFIRCCLRRSTLFSTVTLR